MEGYSSSWTYVIDTVYDREVPMRIAEGKDVRIGVCDIETLIELFDVGIFNPDTGEWREFEVSAYKNELYEFVKEYTAGRYDYLVTYNGISFDQQVLEWVVDTHQKWVDLSGLEICRRISDYAQRLIDDSDYGLFLPYKESRFSIPALDVFRIHHFDNEARRTSLKWCEFMMNMDVEEMPVHHLQRGLTQEDIKLVQEYRRHDVMATYKLFKLTLGETDLVELADYKGKNAIQNRFYIMEDTGLQCLNWSDVKIGEESNKMRYMKAERIVDERSIFPTKVIYPYGKKFKQFFPRTMKFKTKKLQDFITHLGNQYVLGEKQEFPITIGDTTYTIAKGGIHSTEKNRAVVIPKGHKLKDADVGGQYPNACDKFEIYPPHLKRTILINLKGSIQRKDKYKQMGKAATDKAEKSKLKGLETGTKLEMNGGYFGKMGQKGSFLEFPEGVLKVTMANQIEILMLIEAMEDAGFKVISGNTDGIVTMYPEDREADYIKICTEWENAVGNVEMGKLEYANIIGLWQDSVNSYIAKIEDKGEIKIKKKGRFMTEFELHKNKSMRIIPLALEAYFIDGKDPVEFIRNHKNIFDFCIGKKASGQMHYEEQTDGNYEVTPDDLMKDGWKKNESGWYKWENEPYDESPIPTVDFKRATTMYRSSHPVEIKKHKKLVRFYISTEGTVLYKRGWNHEGKPMNNHVNAPTALGQPLVRYFNRFFEADDYKIDYNHYILEVLERIDAIEKTRKAKAFVDSINPGPQLSLF